MSSVGSERSHPAARDQEAAEVRQRRHKRRRIEQDDADADYNKDDDVENEDENGDRINADSDDDDDHDGTFVPPASSRRRPHGSNGESSDDEATNTAPQKSSRRRTAVDEHTEELDEMQATAALSNPEDREFVDDFLQSVMELAQEKVGGQSKFSAIELMQLAGYRIQAKVKRASFNKVNPFNLFLKENKTADNKSLRRPVRGGAEINHGRPSFTGAYQKHMSGEYKLRKAEYQQKAKELNDAPKPKLTTESNAVTWKRIINLATKFSDTLNQHDVHYILLTVPPTKSNNPKLFISTGYGKAFYELMVQKETAIQEFLVFCRGGDLHAQIKAPERRIERKRDVLRKEVTTMILERLNAIQGGSNVYKIPRSDIEKFLADRKVKWAAPVTFGVTQRDIIEKLLSHQLDDLSETYDALENDELKLVPLSRR